MIKGFLFDADGVLIDAVMLHQVAFLEAVNSYGLNITEDYHMKELNGRPTKIKLQILSEQFGLPTDLHKQISDLKQQKTYELIDELIKPDKDKIELIKALKTRYKIAVCSNALRKTVHAMLKNVGVLNYIDGFIGNDDISKPKPDPEIYIVGSKLLELNMNECVVVEDALIGIESGSKARPRMLFIVRGVEEVNLDMFEMFLR